MKSNQHQRIDGKVLYHLIKTKAKTEIIFVEDLWMDEDGWFITVRHVNKKDNSINRESCIIRKDVPTWLDSYLRDGWYEKPTDKNLHIKN
jgi:hypothetical protein